ncbi:MAG: copper chaperone PCu(A)C [Pseudoxanthomonas sp.]
MAVSPRTLLLSVLLLAPATVWAGPCRPRIDRGWLRSPPAGMAMPMAAGFVRISNPCPAPAVLVSVRSPAFAEVSLHRSETVGGVSRMRAVAQLPIAAGATVEFAPGGLHLMLMRPTAALAPGEPVPVSFTFADGRTVETTLTVRPAAAIDGR